MIAILLAAFALLAAPDPAPSRVVGFSDGDTLTVLTADRTQIKVRLHGIDAPEARQDFGAKAKQAASELAFGKDVTLRVHDHDRYGRTVAEVILPDGWSLNRELVGQGMVWWYRQYAPKDAELERLEREAREAHRELWAGKASIAPWEFRKPLEVEDVAQVVANRSSHVYHAPNCRSLAKMKAGNRVEFRSAKEAEGAGYRRAGDCR